MRLHVLRPAPGARHAPKTLGRGTSSGHGKTSGFGHKGQKARSGRVNKRGFEGGQTPLYKKLPKLWRFKNYPFKVVYEVVNVGQLQVFEPNTVVDIGSLVDAGLVDSLDAKVKILGEGEINKPLVVRVHAISRTAREKIESAGGSVEVVE
ncbi:50S ribosomal protein L15 [Coprothermobacteraceae bacterium]|nr:50S ribosomal protein L15 [Coprothermobacteraceae bacterium]